MGSTRASTARPVVAFVRFAPWSGFENPHPRDLMWPVSMLYARSLAERAGWDARIIDLHVENIDEQTLINRVAGWRPRIILADTMTPSAAYALRVARGLRRFLPDCQIWGIGQHATENAESLLAEGSPYSGTLLGEYELLIDKLVAGATDFEGMLRVDDTGERTLIKTGDKQEIDDLDRLPPVDPSPLLLDRYRMRSTHVPRFGRPRWGYLLTSRGCPFRCTFCSATLRQSYGRGFRGHSARRVVDDMLRLHRDFGIGAWYFIDDLFSMDRERVLEMSHLLADAKNKVPWVIQTRPDMVDPEMLMALRKANCVGVKMGIESGSNRVLKVIKKGVKKDRVLTAARDIRDAGLFLTAYYMIGHPSETLSEMEETRRLAHAVNAGMIQLGFHTPYPGSESYDTFAEHVEDMSALSHYETCHVNESNVDSETLEKFQRQFYLGYYLSPRKFARYVKDRLVYKATDPDEWSLAFSTLRYLLGQRKLHKEAPRNAPAKAEERPVVKTVQKSSAGHVRLPVVNAPAMTVTSDRPVDPPN